MHSVLQMTGCCLKWLGRSCIGLAPNIALIGECDYKETFIKSKNDPMRHFNVKAQEFLSCLEMYMPSPTVSTPRGCLSSSTHKALMEETQVTLERFGKGLKRSCIKYPINSCPPFYILRKIFN